MQNITLITSNAKKVIEFNRILGMELPHQSVDIPEIQSLDLEEVVTEKAKAAYNIIGSPVVVEDTSLVFHALGKLPGTLVKWFAQELDYVGMCALLEGYQDRTATVSACIALYDGSNVQLFHGHCEGAIAASPRSGDGFGFDCIFIPKGYQTTWSEMENNIKDTMSHRAQATNKFAEYLHTL